jgi:DNA polymerase-3 subunit gamma/tau
MSLYQKHRPQSLEQVKGNEGIIQTLQGMLVKKETFPHALLFHGQTGCGKTTLARIISKELGCSEMDYKEINTADFRGIDTIRELIKNSQFSAMEGSVRVWVVDECHKLTGDAQNALLKILEDTPPHIYFILCTTESQKLLPTIRGRCSQFQVNPLTDSQMTGLLRRISRDEDVVLETEVMEQIVRDSFGLPRNAISILEQVLNVPEDRRLEVAKQTAVTVSQGIELCRALIKQEPWKAVSKILVGLKDQEAEGIRRIILGYCQSVLLNGDNDMAGLIMEECINPFYDSGFPQLVFACYKICKL